jgi:hypothetical protein
MSGWDINIGDTFDPVLTWLDDAGAPVDVTGATIESHVRRADTDVLVQELTATILDQVASKGRFRITATHLQTELWPSGTLRCNVRVLVGGVRRSTVSFMISCSLPPTRTVP